MSERERFDMAWLAWQAALADRPEPAQRQIRHVYGLYPPNTHIQLQVLGCSGTSEYTDIDVQLPCAPQEPAQPMAHVPLEPTEAMLEAVEAIWPCSMARAYKAMIAAAPPSHPAPSEAGADECEHRMSQGWMDADGSHGFKCLLCGFEYRSAAQPAKGDES